MVGNLGNITGGGGGRVLPGTGGAGQTSASYTAGSGGSNSQIGIDATTSSSTANGAAGGGGGGWGARGGNGIFKTTTFNNYGLGGKAVDLNGYTVTWQDNFVTQFSNSVYGAVS